MKGIIIFGINDTPVRMEHTIRDLVRAGVTSITTTDAVSKVIGEGKKEST